MSKFKVGDEIELRVKVVQIDYEEPCYWMMVLGTDEGQEYAWYSTNQLSAGRLIPRPIKVGDKVKLHGAVLAEVKAIDGGLAWVKLGNGNYFTRVLSNLEPVND